MLLLAYPIFQFLCFIKQKPINSNSADRFTRKDPSYPETKSLSDEPIENFQKSHLDICLEQIPKTKPLQANPSQVLIPASEFSKDHWAHVEHGKASFWINTHNPVEQDIYISGTVHQKKIWDPYVWNMLMSIFDRHPPSEGIFVDVGANLGYFSLMAASMGYQVAAFEPMHRNMAKLASSVKRNVFADRIKLYMLAASHETGAVVSMEATHKTNSGNGKIVKTSHGARDTAETIRLDEILNQNVVAIKIDVEGHEAHAIQGASKLLCSNIVRYVIIELSEETKENRDCPADKLMAAMRRMGYQISDILPGAPAILKSDLHMYPPNVLFTLLHGKAIC